MIFKHKRKIMERCLYIVCLNEEIFNKTGKECFSTFFNNVIEGDLMVAFEGGDAMRKKLSDYFMALGSFGGDWDLDLYDLDDDKVLNKILEENKDVIPTDYGGDNEGMDRGSIPENALTALGPSKYFLYRASKWWRVIASLYAGVTNDYEYDYIIQVDADVAFKKCIPLTKIQEVMKNYAVFYHEGNYRRSREEDGLKGIGVETSFTGYSRSGGGFEVLEKLMEKLTSKDFRSFPRWDDSFLLSHIIHNETERKCKDLINDSLELTDVVERGPFADYICHFKGMNGGCADGLKKYEEYMREKND